MFQINNLYRFCLVAQNRPKELGKILKPFVWHKMTNFILKKKKKNRNSILNLNSENTNTYEMWSNCYYFRIFCDN